MTLDPVAYQPYSDPDDFIREVTDRIWVDRDIDHIYENYEPDSVVHLALGTITTRAEVIEGSTMRMADSAAQPGAMPGQAEDVVWEARGDDAFLSSHLVYRAEDRYYDGQRRRLSLHSVANCLYRRGRMVEEWIARDGLARALQTGQDPDELARALFFRGYSGSWLRPAPADVLAEGDSGPRPDDYRAECELVLELIEKVWNQRNFAALDGLIVRDVFLHSTGETTYIRPKGYIDETLRLLLAFPRAHFEVRDIQTNFDNRYGGLRISVLWKMTGPYEGRPLYGALTNQDVDLLGVSQFLIQDGRIVRERRVFDEIALRAQINAIRGDQSGATPGNIYFF
jgi:SnoaL-like polyketide cyclase